MDNYGRPTVLAVLEELNIDLPKDYETQEWVMVSCPLHDDDNPSFAINLDEGGWVCRAECGSSRDIAYLYSAVTGEDVREVRKKLRNIASEDNTLLDFLLTDNKIKGDEYKEGLFYDKSKFPKFLTDRGFTKDFLREREVGYDDFPPAAVIPIKDENGRLVATVKRFVEPDGKMKYKYSSGFNSKTMLFGVDRLEGTEVWICEGVLDALKVMQAGFEAVAIFGAHLSNEQADIIKRKCWSVVIALDSDAAGRKGAEDLTEKLKGLTLFIVEYPPEKKDPGECTDDEIKWMYEDKALLL